MAKLKYIVLEYFPHAMDGFELRPARIDGHYRDRDDAENVAVWWAEEPHHKETRVVVCEVVMEAKKPRHWTKRDAEPLEADSLLENNQ